MWGSGEPARVLGHAPIIAAARRSQAGIAPGGRGPLRYRMRATATTEAVGTGPRVRLSVLRPGLSPKTNRWPGGIVICGFTSELMMSPSTPATRLITRNPGSAGDSITTIFPFLIRPKVDERLSQIRKSPGLSAGVMLSPLTSKRVTKRRASTRAAATVSTTPHQPPMHLSRFRLRKDITRWQHAISAVFRWRKPT